MDVSKGRPLSLAILSVAGGSNVEMSMDPSKIAVTVPVTCLLYTSQSAGYGLFIVAITQKIADMPSSIIANSGLVFAGKLKRPEDINVVVRAVGREERIDDRDLVKWFPKSPTGWFVCQSSRTRCV